MVHVAVRDKGSSVFRSFPTHLGLDLGAEVRDGVEWRRVVGATRSAILAEEVARTIESRHM